MYATLHKTLIAGLEAVSHVEVFDDKKETVHLFNVKDISALEAEGNIKRMNDLEIILKERAKEEGIQFADLLGTKTKEVREYRYIKRWLNRRYKHAKYTFDGGVAYTKSSLKRKAIVYVMKQHLKAA